MSALIILFRNFPQHQIIGWDLVGTVVKIPENDSPGLISCEIDDDFITVPFLEAEIVSKARVKSS